MPRATIIDRTRGRRDPTAPSETQEEPQDSPDLVRPEASGEEEEEKPDVCYTREEPSAELLRFRESRQPTQRSPKAQGPKVPTMERLQAIEKLRIKKKDGRSPAPKTAPRY